MTKHYVEFFYPGAFFSETSVEKIENRDQKIGIPRNCFGYRFFDQSETIIDGEPLRGERKNITGMTFLGKKYSLEEVKIKFPESKILISNLINNNYSFAVKTVMGNWQPVGKDDTVIDSSSKINYV